MDLFGVEYLEAVPDTARLSKSLSSLCQGALGLL
jgi:hypothetical protein